MFYLKQKFLLFAVVANLALLMYQIQYKHIIKQVKHSMMSLNMNIPDFQRNISSLGVMDPTIYVITPTYQRQTQHPDLTRLAQTLMHIQGLYWILVEDSSTRTEFVQDLLARSGISHGQWNVSTPASETETRGCSQRNAALTWIKQSVKAGVIYFADDDNSYDIRLFSEIRNTKKVGLLPTGNFNTGVSSPVVKNGKVVGFLDPWIDNRTFPVDMACISLNIAFWIARGAPMFDCNTAGYMETHFLEALNITMGDIEPKAKNATLILAWHTKTKNEKAEKTFVTLKNQSDSNIPNLLKHVVFG